MIREINANKYQVVLLTQGQRQIHQAVHEDIAYEQSADGENHGPISSCSLELVG